MSDRAVKQWRIASHQHLAQFVGWAKHKLESETFVVRIGADKRSLDQNAMIYAVYTQIAQQMEGESINDIRNQCKLLIGLPIMQRDREDFGPICSAINALTYPDQLEAMKLIPVTSEMDRKQAREYIDQMIREYGKMGVFITHPEDASYAQYREFQK